MYKRTTPRRGSNPGHPPSFSYLRNLGIHNQLNFIDILSRLIPQTTKNHTPKRATHRKIRNHQKGSWNRAIKRKGQKRGGGGCDERAPRVALEAINRGLPEVSFGKNPRRMIFNEAESARGKRGYEGGGGCCPRPQPVEHCLHDCYHRSTPLSSPPCAPRLDDATLHLFTPRESFHAFSRRSTATRPTAGGLGGWGGRKERREKKAP